VELKDKVVLITGGGTGIGREIAFILAREGANIAVNYSRSEKDANETVRELEALDVAAVAVKADVSKETEVKDMVEAVSKKFGRLDILVNNAGYTSFVPLDDLDGMSEEIWEKTMAVNAKGTFYCARAAVPLLRSGEKGDRCIINTSSIAGFIGRGSSIVYCASKAAVISITKSLAIALAPDIRVNSIAPGYVETRWTDGQDEFKKSHLEATPLGWVSGPKEIAEAALYLARAVFVTGQTLVVDGGRTI
jgi:3-oxoacyl-[acyl-carrier protein] reductase